VLTVVYLLISWSLSVRSAFFNNFFNFFEEFLKGILLFSCQGFILYLLIFPNVDRQ
jgi:hypothetical protein